MAVKVGSFTVNTSTGDQAVTGVGFEPDVVLFLTSAQTSTGTTTSDGHLAFGWAGDGTYVEGNSFSVFGHDGATIAQYLGYHVGTTGVGEVIRVVEGWNGGAGDVATATLTSLDSDGFTVNWGTAPASAFLMFYMAISDVLSDDGSTATSGVLSGTATATTTDGSNFEPDLILSFATGTQGLTTTNQAHIGAAASTSLRAFSHVFWDYNQLSGPILKPYGRQRSDDWASEVRQYDTGDFGSLFDISAISSTGFTIRTDDAESGSATVWWLAFQTFGSSVGVDTQKTSTGTKSVTGLGFRPEGVMFVSLGQTTSSGELTTANYTVGFADGTDERCVWVGGVSGSNPTEFGDACSDTKSIVFIDTPGTVVAEADCTLDDDGFTLDWTTADSTAREFMYVAFATQEVVTFVPQMYRVLRPA